MSALKVYKMLYLFIHSFHKLLYKHINCIIIYTYENDKVESEGFCRQTNHM
jgi:hypothetical protein